MEWEAGDAACPRAWPVPPASAAGSYTPLSCVQKELLSLPSFIWQIFLVCPLEYRARYLGELASMRCVSYMQEKGGERQETVTLLRQKGSLGRHTELRLSG